MGGLAKENIDGGDAGGEAFLDLLLLRSLPGGDALVVEPVECIARAGFVCTDLEFLANSAIQGPHFEGMFFDARSDLTCNIQQLVETVGHIRLCLLAHIPAAKVGKHCQMPR